MEFKGKVINVLPLESGTSKAGNPWQKQGWVLETFDQYPKKVKVDAMGRALENVHMEAGKVYTVSVDAESREFNGRWYTDLRVYRAIEEGAAPASYDNGQGQSAPNNFGQPADPFGGSSAAPFGQPAAPGALKDPTDDLPF